MHNQDSQLLLSSMTTDGPEATWPKLSTGEIEIRCPLPRRLFNEGDVQAGACLQSAPSRMDFAAGLQQPLDIFHDSERTQRLADIGRRREEDSSRPSGNGNAPNDRSTSIVLNHSQPINPAYQHTSTTSASGSQRRERSPARANPLQHARIVPCNGSTHTRSRRRCGDYRIDECVPIAHADRTAVA